MSESILTVYFLNLPTFTSYTDSNTYKYSVHLTILVKNLIKRQTKIAEASCMKVFNLLAPLLKLFRNVQVLSNCTSFV